MRGCVLDSSGSELELLMNSCEQGIKFSGCVTKDWEYHEELRSYQPLKMVSAPSGKRVTRDLYPCKIIHYYEGHVCQRNNFLVPRVLRWFLRLRKFVHSWSWGKVLTCYIKCFDKFCFSTLSVTFGNLEINYL